MSIYYFHFWIIFIKYLYIFSITSTTHVYYIVYGVPGQPPCIVVNKMFLLIILWIMNQYFKSKERRMMKMIAARLYIYFPYGEISKKYAVKYSKTNKNQ